MSKLVVLCIILLLVPALLAHKKPGHKEGGKDAKSHPGTCHYKSTAGVDYDLRLMESKAVTDYQYFDASSGSTFYFRPCGNVKAAGCDEHSSICMVNAAGKAVNFGSQPARWADGAAPGTIEAAYGNGETCNNGVDRKTLVTYVCSENPTSVVSASLDECYVEFTVESRFACPAANYCSGIETSQSCEDQDGLCKWTSGKCEYKLGCTGWKHMSHASALFLIILLTCTGVLLTCTLCLCVCACRKRRRCRQMQRMRCKRLSRKPVKTTKADKKRTDKKAQDVEYAPFQMPYQLVPGGFVPLNPYSNIQGYPMVTFVAPQGEPEQQV